MTCFWDEKEKVFKHQYPIDTKPFCYWWHAHAVDVLIDAFLRTKKQDYLDIIDEELKTVYVLNGNTYLNNWYDDMEWMALALLRLFDVTGKQEILDNVLLLWDDIKTAWNSLQGGGMAWKKDQIDYKNTPANAPAAILAYRLYQRLRSDEFWEWGDRIYNWNLENLTDRNLWIVFDGINRLGDGRIDYSWDYTYCQGVVVGAALERYKISRAEIDLKVAREIANSAIHRYCDAHGGILQYEGKEDCGLFKGIMIRYFSSLVELCPSEKYIRDIILLNAKVICASGITDCGIIGPKLDALSDETIDLAQHLSGIMILEMADRLSNTEGGMRL